MLKLNSKTNSRSCYIALMRYHNNIQDRNPLFDMYISISSRNQLVTRYDIALENSSNLKSPNKLYSRYKHKRYHPLFCVCKSLSLSFAIVTHVLSINVFHLFYFENRIRTDTQSHNFHIAPKLFKRKINNKKRKCKYKPIKLAS